MLLDYLAPPLACDFEPPAGSYHITWLPPGSMFCGITYNPLARACANPEKRRIWIRSDLDPGLTLRLLRHEKGHLNCPDWTHEGN